MGLQSIFNRTVVAGPLQRRLASTRLSEHWQLPIDTKPRVPKVYMGRGPNSYMQGMLRNRTVEPRRVVIVGHYPPPWGGVSIHVLRLAQRLVHDGQHVLIMDPHTRRAVCFTPNQRTKVLTGYKALLTTLAWIRGAVCHVHISAGRRFYKTALLLQLIMGRAYKRVLTIHSGAWEGVLTEMNWIGKMMVRQAFAGFNDVICVNESQRRLLSTFVSPNVGVHVVPAYLTPRSFGNDVPPSVAHLAEEVDIMIVTSGSGVGTYDYLTVIRAAELAQSGLTERLGVVIANYGRWDDKYWISVRDAVARGRVPCVITQDLDPEAFLAVLARAKIYVRATLNDGDSVTIREAGWLNVKVIASSVASRPAGTVLFNPRDETDLANKIIMTIKEPQAGVLKSWELRDNFSEIVRLYS